MVLIPQEESSSNLSGCHVLEAVHPSPLVISARPDYRAHASSHSISYHSCSNLLSLPQETLDPKAQCYPYHVSSMPQKVKKKRSPYQCLWMPVQARWSTFLRGFLFWRIGRRWRSWANQTSKCTSQALEDPEEQKHKPKEVPPRPPILFDLRSSWNFLRKKDLLNQRICEKIKLADGQTAYVLRWSARPDPSLVYCKAVPKTRVY